MATWHVLAMAIVTAIVSAIMVNFLASQTAVRQVLADLYHSTGGLVQATLVASLFNLVCIGTVIFGIGRLTASDVGLRARAVVPAMLITIGFWGAMQFALYLLVNLAGRVPPWNATLWEMGAVWLLGQIIAQILGNAMFEEILFRGFLLPQFFLRATARYRPVPALLLALLVSQALFAIAHVPNRVFILEQSVSDLLRDQVYLLLYGLTLGGVYLVTSNLLLCVGLHTLTNQPILLIDVAGTRAVGIVWYALVFLLLAAWPLVRRLYARRRPIDDKLAV